MISDEDLEQRLLACAVEIAREADGESEDEMEATFAVFRDRAPKLLPLFRALGAFDARGLFVALARRGELVVDEGHWERLPARGQAFFDATARLIGAFAGPGHRGPEAGMLRVIPLSPVKPRDKIFERMGGKDFEKTGGRDLSEGQPTSTAEVTVERPSQRAPVNPHQAMIDAKFAASGLKPPIGSDAADTAAAADYIAGELGSAAPAAPPPQRVRVNRFSDGEAIAGDVFISRPGKLAANAPAKLRADDADAGPEEE